MTKRALTALAVERIKPPKAGQVDHFDAGYPGLALRVSYGGGKSFVYFYRHQGKQRRLTLGQWPGTKLEDARTAWRDARTTLAKGSDPAAERQAQKAVAEPDTFERIADDYERRGFPNAKKAQKKALAPRTVAEYRRQLALLKTAWQGRLVADIRKADVRDLLDDIAENRGPVEANRVYALLSKFFGWWCGRQDDPIPASPMATIAKPSGESSRTRVLSDPEIRELWPAFDRLGHPFGPWAKLLLLTSQRREKVATMRWADLDFEAKVWRQRQKGDRALLVPLVPAVVEILESLPRLKGPFVFTTGSTRKRGVNAGKEPAPPTPISGYSSAKRRVDKLVADAIAKRAKEAGAKPEPMAHWQWHDLRRTARTNLSRLKVHRHVAELVLGHAQGGIGAVYDMWEYVDEKRDALERWATFLAGLTAPNVVQLRAAGGR